MTSPISFFCKVNNVLELSESQCGIIIEGDYYSISPSCLLLYFRSTIGCVCIEETCRCLPHMDSLPASHPEAGASMFPQMYTGKEVHCWVKLCYCWLDKDKGKLIKIIEKQYNTIITEVVARKDVAFLPIHGPRHAKKKMLKMPEIKM